MPPAFLSLDAGTTGIRAVIFDGELRERRAAYSEFRQFFPRPGWVEHDAEEIFRVAVRVLRKAAAAADPRRIAGLEITNQRETVVAWDARTLRPLHRAIVWQDRRTADLCARLKREDWEREVRKRTGLVLDPYFSGTKIRWLIESVPAIRRAARTGRLRLGTIDSWLIAKLTGGRSHATDPSNASRTMLFDIDRRDWDEGLLRLFRARREFLPEVRPSAGFFGTLDRSVLGREIPIAGVAGDQQAALYGQGCWKPGTAKNTYGTGCFLVLNTGRKRRDVPGLLTTLAADERGSACYALEGSVFIGGAVVQWLRDALGAIGSSAESEAVARSVPDSGGVHFVPAFVGLGAPYWDPHARGAILGLTRGTGRAHIVRAALESIAFQSAELFELFRKSGARIRELRVDGGAARNDFLMQFQADLLGIPVLRKRYLESTALGAAALAAVGTGLFASPGRVAVFREEAKRFQPKLAAGERRERLSAWRRAVRRVL